MSDIPAQDSKSDVLFERDGRVARIVLNRPDRLNALSLSMMKAIANKLEEYEADDGIHVVVFRGRGRAFCTGADIHEVAETYLGASAHKDRREINKLAMWFQRNIWEFSKPTILELRGYCFAGANFFLSYCDLVVTSDDALIAASENKGFALEPSMGMWPLTVGMRWTKALFLTGDAIDGKTAERIGMVTRSVPLEELEEYTDWLAQKLAKTDLPLLCLHKQAVNAVFDVIGAYSMLKTGIAYDHMAHMDSKFHELLTRVKNDGAAEAFRWVYSLNDDPTFLEGPPKAPRKPSAADTE